MSRSRRGNVTLVVCAAPLGKRSAEIARLLVENDWAVRVVMTTSASAWVPQSEVELVTGSRPVSEQRSPFSGRSWPPDDATIVAPLTFNTLNKWSLGISDNYALGILNESIALRRRTIAVPMIGSRLWEHPARATGIRFLRSVSVAVIDPVRQDGKELGPVPSGAGDAVAADFDIKSILGFLPDV